MRFEYVPLPPPQDINGMPVYVQNELQRIARFIGGLSEVHESGMYLSAAGAGTTMALTTTPTTITAFDTVNSYEEGLIGNTTAGTFTFLSTSRFKLNFSASISDQGGGSAEHHIGVYLNNTLIQPTHSITFTGSAYTQMSFMIQNTAQAGDVITLRMSTTSGTDTATFASIDVDVEGKPIDI